MGAVAGILFDKDGTLLDYHSTWMPANYAVAMELAGGDTVLRDALLAAGGWSRDSERVASGTALAAGDLQDIAELWLPMLPDAGHDRDSLVRFMDKAFPANMVPTAVCALPDLLGRLGDMGYALGVATADSVYGLNESLKPFNILDRFVFAAGFDSGHGRKPGPGMVLGFCQVAGIDPQDVLVVGDNRHDVEMAAAAGAFAVGVLTGTSDRDELMASGAVAVLPSIAELPDYLTLANAGN